MVLNLCKLPGGVLIIILYNSMLFQFENCVQNIVQGQLNSWIIIMNFNCNVGDKRKGTYRHWMTPNISRYWINLHLLLVLYVLWMMFSTNCAWIFHSRIIDYYYELVFYSFCYRALLFWLFLSIVDRLIVVFYLENKDKKLRSSGKKNLNKH